MTEQTAIDHARLIRNGVIDLGRTLAWRVECARAANLCCDEEATKRYLAETQAIINAYVTGTIDWPPPDTTEDPAPKT